MKGTQEQLAALIFAVIMVTSVFAIIPVAGANATDGTDRIAHQDPTNVKISEQLQSKEGEVVVVARLEEASLTPTTDAATAKAQLKTHAEASQEDLVAFADQTDGAKVLKEFWLTNAVLMKVDKSQASLQQVASIQGVERLHPNYEYKIPEPGPGAKGTDADASAPSIDQAGASQDYTYGLEQINAPDAWHEFGTRGEGAKVAVLDTGVDVDHPAIDLHTRDPNDPTYPGGWAEFDAQGNRVLGSTPHDSDTHGTHTSGTVVGDASGLDDVPQFGVAPEAKLMHGLVLPGGSGTWAQVTAGMQWAVNEDADVISMSLGAPIPQADRPIEPVHIETIQNARAAGTIVVTSSGNSGLGSVTTPGSLYNSFSIGASDAQRGIAGFSTGGQIDPTTVWTEVPADWPSQYVYPDVTAPGVSVFSSYPLDAGAFNSISGTSMAAPHVSGTIALMISAAEDDLSPTEIETALEASADKPAGIETPKDPRYGTGIIDAHEAVTMVTSETRVTGTVTDSDGEPISAVSVSSTYGPQDTTSPNGEFRLAVEPGTNRLEIGGFGYQTEVVTVDVAPDGTETVEVSLDERVDARNVDVSAGSGKSPDLVEQGESLVASMEVTSVESMAVYPNVGTTYGLSNATLYVHGQEVAFGERITFSEPVSSDEVRVRVETGDNETGTVDLRVVLGGPGTNVSVPLATEVMTDVRDVAIVDAPDNAWGSDIAMTLDERLPEHYREVVLTTNHPTALENLADEFDVLVVQRIARNDTMANVVDRTSASGTGLIVLDGHAGPYPQRLEFSGTADGITRMTMAIGEPAPVYSPQYPNTRLGQALVEGAATNYTLVTNHSIFDGVGSANDTVTVYGASGGYGLPAWFGNYSGTTLANTSIVGSELGTGVAIDETEDRILMTLGRTFFVFGDTFTQDANEILNNSVTYLDDPADRSSDRFEITELTASNATVSQGDQVTVTATIENTGDLPGTQPVEYRVAEMGVYDSRVVTLESGNNTTVTFTLDTSELRVDSFGHGVFTLEDSASTTLTVEGTVAPDVTGNGEAAKDLDGDGLYEDINGDGSFNIIDVSALLDHYEDATVQDNVDLFDFNGDGSVNIIDVSELLEMSQ
jgi:subtilisin family serine protease